MSAQRFGVTSRWTRVKCSRCGADVSSPVVTYDDFVIRAWVECPECIEKYGEDECSHPSLDGLGIADLWVCMACARVCRIERVDSVLSQTVALNPDEVKSAFLASDNQTKEAPGSKEVNA